MKFKDNINRVPKRIEIHAFEEHIYYEKVMLKFQNNFFNPMPFLAIEVTRGVNQQRDDLSPSPSLFNLAQKLIN